MNTTICCFAGHSDMNGSDAKEKIKNIAQRLITEKNVTEFWVGNYGGFDACAASAVRELKLKYPDIKLILVIPYSTKKIEGYRDWYEKNYDKIMLADIPVTTPGKYKIIKANEYMVENSDFLICYIDHTWGGAYRTYNYAKRKKKEIFNVADSATEKRAE